MVLTLGRSMSFIPHMSAGDPMRRSHPYRGLATTVLFLLASCVSPDAAPTESRVVAPHVWAAKGGPPPSDSVRLGMTVNDDAAFQIGSDSLGEYVNLSLIHISEPTRQAEISYAVFC